MTNIQNVSFNYQETVTGSVAPSVAMRGALSLQVIDDNTDTLANEFQVIQSAATNEATAKRKQIGMQAAGQAVQGFAQIASGVAVGAASLYSSFNGKSAALQNEQAELDKQLKPLEDMQSQLKASARTPVATGDIAVRDADAPVNPAVEARKTQFGIGDFSANPEAQKSWNDALPPLREQGDMSDEDYQTYLDSRNLDKEAMSQMDPKDPNSGFKTALNSLESQISDLNKQIGVKSDQISNRASMINNVGTIGKEGAGALGSFGQSVTTEASAKWSTSEIYSQNMSSMVQMMMKTLEAILQAGYQGLDSTTNMLVSAANISGSIQA